MVIPIQSSLRQVRRELNNLSFLTDRLPHISMPPRGVRWATAYAGRIDI